ncbi:hypothetical protein BC830DRAFT_17910 [Chytriomyces sp. MP71]|nr:hypothetical protein BC830DRAFT_17910 [Chytriomyces sp. MP71]
MRKVQVDRWLLEHGGGPHLFVMESCYVVGACISIPLATVLVRHRKTLMSSTLHRINLFLVATQSSYSLAAAAVLPLAPVLASVVAEKPWVGSVIAACTNAAVILEWTGVALLSIERFKRISNKRVSFIPVFCATVFVMSVVWWSISSTWSLDGLTPSGDAQFSSWHAFCVETSPRNLLRNKNKLSRHLSPPSNPLLPPHLPH